MRNLINSGGRGAVSSFLRKAKFGQNAAFLGFLYSSEQKKRQTPAQCGA